MSFLQMPNSLGRLDRCNLAIPDVATYLVWDLFRESSHRSTIKKKMCRSIEKQGLGQ
jgi:hypothetical protein